MWKRSCLPLVVVVLVALGSAAPMGGFYNSPECSRTGEFDCWKCRNIGFLNPPFCWALTGANSEIGQCGCGDLSPYGLCYPEGDFCGNIEVWG